MLAPLQFQVLDPMRVENNGEPSELGGVPVESPPASLAEMYTFIVRCVRGAAE
jgi:hypothetical protein